MAKRELQYRLHSRVLTLEVCQWIRMGKSFQVGSYTLWFFLSFPLHITSHRTYNRCVCVWEFGMWNGCFPGILEKIWQTQVQHISFFFLSNICRCKVHLNGRRRRRRKERKEEMIYEIWLHEVLVRIILLYIYSCSNLLFYLTKNDIWTNWIDCFDSSIMWDCCRFK